MNTHTRKSMIGALALVASLSAPMAFAQQSAEQAPPTEAATSASAAQDAAATTDTQPTAATAPKKSWSDVDGDKDGNLSKNEASAVPALGQVFDQADVDANGSLTPDEYKNYVAKVQSSGGAKKGG